MICLYPELVLQQNELINHCVPLGDEEFLNALYFYEPRMYPLGRSLV